MQLKFDSSVKNNYKIKVLLLDRFQGSVLSGVYEVFYLINAIQTKKNNKSLFEVSLTSLDGTVVLDHLKQEIIVESNLSSVDECDALIVIGTVFPYKNKRYKKQLNFQTKKWFQEQHEKGTLILAVNSGIFLLAETGLLNNQVSTVSSQHFDAFSEVFPKLKVNQSAILLNQNRIVTASALSSFVDISVEIINDALGEGADDMLVNLMIPYKERQSRNFINTLISDKESFISNIQFIFSNPDFLKMSVKELASKMSVSERTLLRKMRLYANCTPKDYINEIRIKRACVLLRETDKQVKEIAILSGFSNDITFRRIFLNKRGCNPQEYR